MQLYKVTKKKIAQAFGKWIMDAVTQGSMQAGKPAGGFNIGKEAGQWFFSGRKHGVVDASVKINSLDKTAVVGLVLMNYDSFYSKLLYFLNDCEESVMERLHHCG
ncbi:unnamed protein product [Sphenostylis stenocarpa]|uniref:Uncharacterized protein n=1 Tax=Sphenostylis stenocarpa TaxID=92480 RepID=A0AA86T662_9FABA|nr:unnamed protein product [Sphenostylis stenocarpa]